MHTSLELAVADKLVKNDALGKWVASARQPAIQAPSEDVLTMRVPPQKPSSRLLLLLLRRERGTAAASRPKRPKCRWRPSPRRPDKLIITSEHPDLLPSATARATPASLTSDTVQFFTGALISLLHPSHSPFACGGCILPGVLLPNLAVRVRSPRAYCESESTIEQQADMYVSKIVPDPATVAYPEQGSVPAASCSDHAYDSCEEPPTPPPHRRHGGRTPRPTPMRRRRRRAVDGDERVVCKAQSGRWSSLLPLGTVVRRPSVKLVQLVAQAIHESPHRMLRVTHVYAALQNRYPYYRLQDKKGISSWKSSVRHSLYQKWFKKLRPTSGMYETVRPRGFFWGLNYSQRWVGACVCAGMRNQPPAGLYVECFNEQTVPTMLSDAEETLTTADKAATIGALSHRDAASIPITEAWVKKAIEDEQRQLKASTNAAPPSAITPTSGTSFKKAGRSRSKTPSRSRTKTRANSKSRSRSRSQSSSAHNQVKRQTAPASQASPQPYKKALLSKPATSVVTPDRQQPRAPENTNAKAAPREANGKANYTVSLLSRHTEQILAMIRRVSNRRSGLRERHLLRLVEACVISRSTYHLPFHRLMQSEQMQVDTMLRKATKLAHCLPHYTATKRLLALGTHNTLDDEGEQRDDEASTLWSGLHENTEPPGKTTTALIASDSRLQLDQGLLAPPEPQSPSSKRKLSTVQGSEFAPVTSAAQSADDLVSVGSPPSSLPHIASADLWKSESMNPVGWPAPGRTEKQALRQPSVSASAASPSVWDGMYFQPVRAFGGASWWATPPPMPAALYASNLLDVDDDRDVLLAQPTQQGGVLQDSLRWLESRSPNNLCEHVSTEPMDMFWAYVIFLLESGGLGHDEPLAPLPSMCSPSYVKLTSLTQTALTTAPSTRAPTPSQQPPAISGPSEPPQLHDILHHCRHFASGDSADVRPPDTRLSTRGVELRLRGWNLEQDLREAGSSSGAPPELSPIKRCCSGARPAKTARMQRKTTMVTLTAAAMPHRHRSYEDNFVNRQSQELARLSLTEERDEGEVEMASAEASATLPSRKATVIFAGGTGD
ncbi:hypothetical protein HPB49_009282 [Dermacentor silvarum]|uniref:Uncharacterized protein n=1 Tax=Dermacentor silvarum TaxID=543639 RepID=A0ACB8DYF6_DERSI|nr:hypothetical protein HPB49_009282 [Dermacentor silvarum]